MKPQVGQRWLSCGTTGYEFVGEVVSINSIGCHLKIVSFMMCKNTYYRIGLIEFFGSFRFENLYEKGLVKDLNVDLYFKYLPNQNKV